MCISFPSTIKEVACNRPPVVESIMVDENLIPILKQDFSQQQYFLQPHPPVAILGRIDAQVRDDIANTGCRHVPITGSCRLLILQPVTKPEDSELVNTICNTLEY